MIDRKEKASELAMQLRAMVEEGARQEYGRIYDRPTWECECGYVNSIVVQTCGYCGYELPYRGSSALRSEPNPKDFYAAPKSGAGADKRERHLCVPGPGVGQGQREDMPHQRSTGLRPGRRDPRAVALELLDVCQYHHISLALCPCR